MAGTAKDNVAAALSTFESAVAAAPGRHAFAPRLAPKGKKLTTPPDALGKAMTLQADAHGIVRPETPEQVRAADILGLPVISKE